MVWGAAGGIGSALVQAAKKAGWRVGAVSRAGGATLPPADFAYEGDVADLFAVQRAVYAAAQEMGAIDLWIYSIGDIVSSPVAAMEEDVWQRILDANLSGAYRTIHHSLPLLAENAHIVFIGAYSERLQLPGLAAYAAAKAGLEAFAVALGKEQRHKRVTVVRPGAVDTPLWTKMPMRLPRSAATPDAVAERVLQAYHEGHSGVLDL